ncbi:CopG family transcriptional regulator [Pseudomonas sp. Z3-8]|uniref:CopG family transcriptional regulator n=1 Tax=Pseudomonas sp. Z3-8 TaxID=2817412 RepID=UPI003DA7A73D
MTEITLNLPEHPSSSPADLPRMDGVDNHILRDCTEHEKALAAQIEMAVDEADRGRFASADLVAAMRARRWGTM